MLEWGMYKLETTLKMILNSYKDFASTIYYDYDKDQINICCTFLKPLGDIVKEKERHSNLINTIKSGSSD